jgi:hypothetical protein
LATTNALAYYGKRGKVLQGGAWLESSADINKTEKKLIRSYFDNTVMDIFVKTAPRRLVNVPIRRLAVASTHRCVDSPLRQSLKKT